MGKQIGANSTIKRIRLKAIAVLLPTTCRFLKNVRQRTPSGAYTTVNVAQTYNGETDIPCRLDIARFFRSSDVENQAITVNDYELHIPYDATLQPDWRVEINGELYEVRKDMGSATNTITKMYLITRLATINNPVVT